MDKNKGSAWEAGGSEDDWDDWFDEELRKEFRND